MNKGLLALIGVVVTVPVLLWLRSDSRSKSGRAPDQQSSDSESSQGDRQNGSDSSGQPPASNPSSEAPPTGNTEAPPAPVATSTAQPSVPPADASQPSIFLADGLRPDETSKLDDAQPDASQVEVSASKPAETGGTSGRMNREDFSCEIHVDSVDDTRIHFHSSASSLESQFPVGLSVQLVLNWPAGKKGQITVNAEILSWNTSQAVAKFNGMNTGLKKRFNTYVQAFRTRNKA